MLTHLIIPDIHNKFGVAEAIVAKHPEADTIWFLGDYFDSFEDSRSTPSQNQNIALDTAKWLKWSLSQPNRRHLFGNHDLPYVTHNTVDCPGWNHDKHKLVESIIELDDWQKMDFYGAIDNILLTHAGLSRFLQSGFNDASQEDVFNFMEFENNRAKNRLFEHNGVINSLFWARGRERGGYEQTGGVVWCGLYEEFYPIESVRQIFGHSCDPTVHPFNRLSFFNKTAKNPNYCIDSYLFYYATVSDSIVTIHRNDWTSTDFTFEITRNTTQKWLHNYCK